MISLDIKLNEIMEAANENCKKVGYKIMLMEDAIFEITGVAPPCDTPCPMYVGTNPERILGASILMYETYLEDLAAQIEDDLGRYNQSAKEKEKQQDASPQEKA